MKAFARTESSPQMAPPASDTGPWGWAKENLFNGWFNSILTLIGLYVAYLVISNLFLWGVWNATFVGDSREACPINPDTGKLYGACWPFVAARWEQFLFGFYPEAERWRVVLATVLVVAGFLPLLTERFEYRNLYFVSLVVLYPLVAYWLFTGGTVGIPVPANDNLAATIAWFAFAAFGIWRFILPLFRPGGQSSSDYLVFLLFVIIPAGFVYLALSSLVISGWQSFAQGFFGDNGSILLSMLLLVALAAVLYLVAGGGLKAVGSIVITLVAFPFIAMVVFDFGQIFGVTDAAAYLDPNLRYIGTPIHLPEVETERWGGLFLTMVLAGVAITSSLPLGILLALGRRSDMPAISTLCTIFIELMRGVPLITVLFMASVMLPLFLPEGVNFDKLLRALVGLSLFASAYMAEIVRGGLQAIPKGQYEAADALGLGYWKKMGLIILPQALKIGIPNIVSLFIGLFKDTTLVLIIGLFDFLNTVQTGLSDPNWIGLSKEGYIFAAIVYFIFCFAMSRYSMSLERKLDTGHKR